MTAVFEMLSNIGKRDWNEVGSPPAILVSFITQRHQIEIQCNACACLSGRCLQLCLNVPFVCIHKASPSTHWEHLPLQGRHVMEPFKLRDSPFGNLPKVWWRDVKGWRTCISIWVVLLFLFKVLQVLRQMPKGGALHLHFASASSLEWVVNQGYLDSISRSPSWDLELGLYTYCNLCFDDFNLHVRSCQGVQLFPVTLVIQPRSISFASDNPKFRISSSHCFSPTG